MIEGCRTEERRHRPSALLATKLFIPPVRPGFVARRRLLQALDRGSLTPLTVVTAPAGFGKSALLSDWATRRAHRVAWLSIDPGDNDPARFWRYVVAALDGIRRGLRPKLEPHLTRDSAPIETVVDELINEFAGDHGAAALVLDDYHAIESQRVHDSVEHLVERSPPDLTVIVAGRTIPPLNLARLRATGELVELGAADLRFEVDEGRRLLEAAIGVPLSDEVAQLLARRTEGWAAGLQLAALSLRERADMDAFVATFSGSNRHIVDYLSAEVLASQSEDIREFLMRISILDRLTAELCNVLTDRSDSQALLEAVERANLFLVPLDDVRGWWRFHHLFAELLRARLHATDPELERELHRRASAWHGHFGSADDAFEHGPSTGTGDALVEPLSERELEVLGLVAQGLPNAEIAENLFVTEDTIKKHVTHILGKLGVTNRTQAAARHASSIWSPDLRWPFPPTTPPRSDDSSGTGS